MSNSLLVPIELDVLMANEAQIKADTFSWWGFDYDALNVGSLGSPEPFNAYLGGPEAGAYLHWTLPRALRSSHPGNTTQYPLVPNRWLVVRTYQINNENKSTAWVVQSDCPNTDAGAISSPFMVESSQIESWKKSSDPVRQAAGQAYSAAQWQVGILQGGQDINGSEYTDSYIVSLGKASDLSGWEEETDPSTDKPFLTAVAPGNLAYSAYYPHCQGMFTYYDDLSGVPNDAVVSYFVTGWYSNPTADIIASGNTSFTGCDNIGDVLKALNWTMADGDDPGTIERSLYTGMSFEMQWNGQVASDDELATTISNDDVNVSIGNSDIDAFTTLVGAQLTNATKTGESTKKYTPAQVTQFTKLLRAFQYDLLPELNKVNGEVLLERKNAGKWFQSKYGGTEWVITVENDGALGKNEAKWLATLNKDQHTLDEALAKLVDLQWQLNTAWYKYSMYMGRGISPANLPDNYIADLKNHITPNGGGILDDLISQFDAVSTAMAKVPQPATVASNTPQQNLQAGIASFAAGKKLPDNMTLKAANRPNYWLPNNPNIVVSGIKSPAIANPNDALVVRRSAQLITQFTIDSKTASVSTASGIAPALTFTAGSISEDIIKLYNEFGLLNPANAGIIASALSLKASDVSGFMKEQAPLSNYLATEALPTNSQAAWLQDWAPLYMDWKIYYAQIPYEYGDTPSANWTFDGTDYNLVESPQGVQPDKAIDGRSLLSPHIQFTLGNKLNAFLADYAEEEAELEALYKEIDSLDKWAFLSQDLTHLNTFLTQRDPRPFRRPTIETASGLSASYAELIGFAGSEGTGTYVTPSHVQGLVESVPTLKSDGKASDYNFHAIRASQAYISRLYIYDRFGRTLKLIDDLGDDPLNSPEDFPLIADGALAVPAGEKHITSEESQATISSPFELPPRLLQPARLDMLLVDHTTTAATPAADIAVLGQEYGVNPICGWLIPNHLDQSLMLFDNTGGNLGQLSLAVPTDSSTTVIWNAPVSDSTAYTSVADITKDYPEFGAFISGMVGKSPTEFGTFMGTIDSTLWSTAPLGRRTDQNLSVLIGRPLALTRVMLQFVLDGAPITSQDWPEPIAAPKAFDSKVPDFTKCKFGIRLGDMATREDGVIGYFTGTNYDVFNSVASPQSATSYVSEIGPLPDAVNKVEAGTNFINLPFDGSTKQFVSILVDPRASIHAITGIFPAKKLIIPKEFVDPVLSKISLFFRTGPLLTKVSTAAANATYPENISYLPISEKNGQWSWWEKVPAEGENEPWLGYGLTKASLNADFKEGKATVRDGYLRFDTDLE